MNTRILSMVWIAALVAIPCMGANIVVVSDDGMADELVPFIQANFPAHSVVAAGSFDDAGAGPPTGWPVLAPQDLVIVSRHTNSGNYDDSGDEQDFWTGMEQPLLLCSAFLAREQRWNFVATRDQDNAGGEANETVFTAEGLADPLVAGITLSGSAADLHSESVDSMIDDGSVGGGTVLARDVPGSHIVLSRYPAGAALANTAAADWNGANAVFGGPRVYFGMDTGDSIAKLTVDGQQLLVNVLTELLAVPPPPVSIRAVNPPANVPAHPQPVIRVAVEDGTHQVSTGSVSLTVDGTGVSPAVSREGSSTIIRYDLPALLPPLTVVSATLTFSDTQVPAVQYTNNWSFTVADWVTLPPDWAYPIASKDVTAPGFFYRDAQHDGFAFDGALPTTADRALAQVAGKLVVIDSFDGTPYPETSLQGTGPDGSFILPGFINLNNDAGITGLGNFHAELSEPFNRPEEVFPGIDGSEGLWNFSTETITFLELTAGVYTLGVNSDDGFVLMAGSQPRDLFAPDLARFDGGRGSSDTLFSFVVEQDGLYPIRLVHYQGTGAGSLELFSVDPVTGDPLLINDAIAGSVPAWRSLSTPATPPYLFWLTPEDNSVGVAMDLPLAIELRDGGLTVDPGTIALTINGAGVTPTSMETIDGATTVSYAPPGGWTESAEIAVEVVFGSGPSALQTQNFSFVVARLPTAGPAEQDSEGLVVLEAEDFNANVAPTNHQWAFAVAEAGFAGDGYMQALPDTGANHNGADVTNLSPRLDYEVNFVTAGTHRVWVRGLAEGGVGDSVHAGLNGSPSATASNITGFADGLWDWSDGGVYTIEVPSAGLHTVNLWMREDGFRMDRILLTPDLAAEPLEVQLTAPANLSTFAAGADITLAADAAALGTDVAMVEFFAGTNLIGQADTEPYQVTWNGAPTGRYELTAVATDALGGQAISETVGIAVGEVPTAVLYVLDSPASVNASDQAIIDRLLGFGIEVDVVGAAASRTEDAFTRDLVMVSSTIVSGDVGDKFQSVAVPVVNWEQAIQDNMWMTLNTDGVDRGNLDGQIAVEIVDETHPMAAGFPNGFLLVSTVSTRFAWGLPTNTASVVATAFGDPSKILIYGYEEGAAMYGGNTAPARRVGLFLNDNTFSQLNEDGIALVDAAVSWALNMSLQPPAAVPLSMTLTGGQLLRIAWPADDPAAALHANTDLQTDDWQPVTAPVVPDGGTNTVTITPTADREHYRLQ